jgi:K(+)-stimulated pyrophosphate-energized sodium pump
VKEFALILAIQFAALVYALVAGRRVLTPVNVNRLRRISGALERATGTVQLGHGRVVALGAAAIAAVLGGLYATRAATPEVGHSAAAIFVAVGVLLGAALTFLVARAAARLGIAASVRTTQTASRGLDRALISVVDAGGAISLATEAVCSLGLAALFGIAFALAGGTVAPPAQSLALARQLTALLASFPLGAALAAVVCQRGGGTYQAASRLGGGAVAGLTRDNPQNPALIGELAGDHLGHAAARASLEFVSSATAQIALLALGLAITELDGLAAAPQALLPFLVRAFFVLASGFGFAAVRVEEMRNPSGGLLRGYASSLVVGLAGLAGACLWLAREHFFTFFLAGASGALAPCLVGAVVWSRFPRPASAVSRDGDPAKLSDGALVWGRLGAALEQVLWPVVGLAAASTAAFQLGARSGISSGGLWALLLSSAALLGAVPFAHAVSAVGTLAEGAAAMGALAAADAEAQRRAARLNEVRAVAVAARAELIAGMAIAALLSALALPAMARQTLRFEVGLFDPAVTWSAALGAVFALGYAGAAARAAVQGAREIAAEVERQLKRFPRDNGIFRIPNDFSPSYKLCVEAAARLSVSGLAKSSLIAFALPAGLALALRLIYSGAESNRAIEGLMSIVLLSGLVGFALALAFEVARALLTSTSRYPRATLSGEPSLASFGEGAADVFGHAAGPAAQAFVIGVGALALALAPFMN